MQINRLTRNLTKLVAIDSVLDTPRPGAPFGKANLDALTLMLGLGKEYGFCAYNGDGYYGYIDWIPLGADSDTPIIGILGHLDIVPCGDGWTSPALELTQRDDCLYGRGVVDNKGPCMAALEAMYRLKNTGFVPKHIIRLILGCNEESGSACIAEYRNRGERVPVASFVPDADFSAVISEMGILHLQLALDIGDTLSVHGIEIQGGERPNVVPSQCRVTVPKSFAAKKLHSQLPDTVQKAIGNRICIDFLGTSCHAMEPHKGDNAIHKALCAIGHMTNDANLTQLCRLICTPGATKNLGIHLEDISGTQTLNIGKIDSNANTITLTLDLRCPCSQDIDKLQSAIITKLIDFHPKLSQLHYAPPLNVDPESVLVRSLVDAYTTVTGNPVHYCRTGGGTYARALPNAVAFGPNIPGTTNNIHNIDEHIKLDHLINLVDIYSIAIQKLDKNL